MHSKNFAAICLVLTVYHTVLLSTKILCQGRPFSSYTETPIDQSLFRRCAVQKEPASNFEPYVHPRIVFNRAKWITILESYVNTIHTRNTWSNYHFRTSLRFGPTSSFIEHVLAIDTTAYEEFVSSGKIAPSSQQRVGLIRLGSEILHSNEETSHALFLCALWSSVNKRLPNQDLILPENSWQRCISAGVKWASILIAHRISNCAGLCPNGPAARYAYVWDYQRRFTVNHDWYTSGLSLALLYDVAYDDLTTIQRRRIRSALALLVFRKESWGTTLTSTVGSPNCALHPHRCYSNWATYHSNLYLTNLAIEGESDFDPYATNVLNEAKSLGFDAALDYRFFRTFEAYMNHSVYPDGATFEDGYTYFIAMREGSLGLVAAARRGANVIDTPRFRNFIHIASQMTEPWPCGHLIGHASGGGLGYPTYAAFFRYAYPKGVLPTMIFRQRFGSISSTGTCRILWHQHLMQVSILARDLDPSVLSADSFSSLPFYIRKKLPLSLHTSRRGLIILRNSWNEWSTYVHFDARPDAFFPGHDNADRGVFTFSSLGQTWLTDLPEWRYNKDSRKHNLMHVDGLAQGEKVPGVTIIKTEDNENVAIAAADLTYAYNVQWAPGHNQGSKPYRISTSYTSNGQERKFPVLFKTPEQGSPRDFGWPDNDDGEDIGMTRKECSIHGDSDMGFSGLWIWKRNYRKTDLKYAVRSVALIRSRRLHGYVIVVDSFGTSDDHHHLFESYLILHDDVTVHTELSSCAGSRCSITLQDSNRRKNAQVDVFTTETLKLSYRVEMFMSEAKHHRIIIQTKARHQIVLWYMIHAYETGTGAALNFLDSRTKNIATVEYDGIMSTFAVDELTHILNKVKNPSAASSPQPSPSATSSTVPRSASGDPVPTITLNEEQEMRLLESAFTSNQAEFFISSKRRFQTVLQINLPNIKVVNQFLDTVTICRKGARNVNGNIHLKVFYCGNKNADQVYKERHCSKLKVHKATNPSNCFASSFERNSRLGRNYYVVVSTDRISGKNWVFWISHRRTVI